MFHNTSQTLLFAWIAIASLTSPAVAGPPKKNKTPEAILESGQEEHANAIDKVAAAVQKEFDRLEKSARKQGNRESIAKIESWRSQFDKDQTIPPEFTGLRKRRWSAHAKLVDAYQSAIQKAVQNSQDQLATTWQDELNDFIEEHIPFETYSTWHGQVLVKSSKKGSKPYEGPATCKILQRSHHRFKIEVNHSHERQWHIEFTLVDNQWQATKLVLTKVQNHFGDQLGPRDILDNRVHFDGSTWTIAILRKENQDQVKVTYQFQQDHTP